MPKNNKVSKVKNIKDTKEIPINNNINIVSLGFIDIFFKAKVGILLINRTAMDKLKYGTMALML